MQVFCLLSPFYSFWEPSPMEDGSSSLTHPECVSMVILNPVKLTMKINHPASPKRRMVVSKQVFVLRQAGQSTTMPPPCTQRGTGTNGRELGSQVIALHEEWGRGGSILIYSTQYCAYNDLFHISDSRQEFKLHLKAALLMIQLHNHHQYLSAQGLLPDTIDLLQSGKLKAGRGF